MTQLLTRNKKEEAEEKLVRLEKEFNKKIQKNSKFAKQINGISESFKNLAHNFQLPSTNTPIISEEQIRRISEESEKVFINPREETKKVENKSSMGVEVTETGNFYYKNKKLCIGTNSNAGKFFKYLLEDKNHFVPDIFCVEKLNSQVKNIPRDVNNKYLKKDGLKAIMNRSGDGNGYVLARIVELRSL